MHVLYYSLTVFVNFRYKKSWMRLIFIFMCFVALINLIRYLRTVINNLITSSCYGFCYYNYNVFHTQLFITKCIAVLDILLLTKILLFLIFSILNLILKHWKCFVAAINSVRFFYLQSSTYLKVNILFKRSNILMTKLRYGFS